MKVSFVAQDAWQAALDAAQQRRAGPSKRMGFAVLRLAQSSGLPVPVETAFEFADWLLGAGGVAEEWDQVFPPSLLRNEGLGIAKLSERLAAQPFHAVRLVFFPVMARVQEIMGAGQFLTARTAADGPAFAGHDAQLTTAYRATLSDLLQSKAQSDKRPTQLDAGELKAWRLAIGLRTLQFLRLGEEWDDTAPECDFQAAEFFLGAGEIEPSEFWQQKSVPQIRLATTRTSHRFQSDGIEGIRHASPSEDPSAMLASQMVYPTAIMVERIANEGFVAYDRPPPLPEKHRYVFCALTRDQAETLALSATRAAFWRAAKEIESELANSSGELSFAWINVAQPDTVTLHMPPIGFRAGFGQSALAWMQKFDGVGAPFWAGPSSLRIGKKQDTEWPEDIAGVLTAAGLPVAASRERNLRLHISAVTDVGDVSVIAQWGEQVGALNPAVYEQQTVTIGHGNRRILVNEAESFELGSEFPEQCSSIATLSQAWLVSMRRVLAHG